MTRIAPPGSVVTRRAIWTAVAAIAGGATFCQAVFAQAYPSRPVKLIVAFPAGGPLDFIARAVGDKMADRLHQPFIVENKAGAGGNLGTEAVVRAEPDGYTLLVVINTTLTVNPQLYKQLAFDPQKDLRPISLLAKNSQMLVVHPSLPVNSTAEFVAFAKKQPVIYAHAGHGSPGHLAMEYFRLRADFQAVPVPYKGNAPLVTDLLGGHVQAGFVATAGVVELVRSGKLRGLATSATSRSPLAPDIPTISESGHPGFKVVTSFLILAPAGVPDDVAAMLEREVQSAVRAPDLQDKFRLQDLETIGSTGAEAAAELRADTELWSGIIKAAKIQLD